MYLPLKPWWFSNVNLVFQGKGINIHPRVNFRGQPGPQQLIPILPELRCFLRNFWLPWIWYLTAAVCCFGPQICSQISSTIQCCNLTSLTCCAWVFEVIWGGGNDFSKWLMSTGGDSIAYIYILPSKIPTPVHTYYCILCFWGENQKRVHNPKWVNFVSSRLRSSRKKKPLES